jgi:hypothetical protein
MFFCLLIIAGLGIIWLFSDISTNETYGSRLEEYIVSNNPQSTYDVERLATEYNKKNSEGFLWFIVSSQV